jgi:hypothetical protein
METKIRLSQLDNLEGFIDQKLESIDTSSPGAIEYDLTNQLDGSTQVFTIDETITNANIVVYYQGLRLVRNLQYTVDLEEHTITTLLDIPPDSDENRHLIIVAKAENVGTGIDAQELIDIENTLDAIIGA